jgi:hypothetical protein
LDLVIADFYRLAVQVDCKIAGLEGDRALAPVPVKESSKPGGAAET